jgi:DNA-binding NtrC family response regulator
MTRSISRILCVDSSPQRLRRLTDALERAGFQVWTAAGASDAVCLASGLHFDAVAIDQSSAAARPEVWDCLAESHPGLPILLHSGAPRRLSMLCPKAQAVSSSNHEVVLALLLLLLSEQPASKVRQPQCLAA